MTKTEQRVVWIVDDSPLEAEQARRTLGSVFATRVFSDGATLLEQIVASPLPDVLVLDWVMPGLSGIEVCEFLRTQEATRDLSILLLTSQYKSKQIVEGLTAGANDYLIKPYSPDELLARVTSLLRAKQERERAAGAEQQAAADALHKTDLRYRALIEGMPDLVIVITAGSIVYMNPLALRVFADGKRERILGKPIESIIHPDDRDAALARFALTTDGGSSRLIERRMLRHDGSAVNVELSSQSVVFDSQLAVVAVARDITEQKQTQTQLLVSERMASVGMLAAGVAHEINNPLASVLANLDFALDEMQRLPEPSDTIREVEQSLREARAAGERVRQIVLDLKIFSRGDNVERRGPVHVERVLESSLRMATNQIRHRARLVRDFGDVPPVLANEARLGQVFLNLIVNAAEAIPEGRAEQNEVRIVTRMFETRVAIEIHDTGAGMSPAVLQNLFTPFFTTKAVGLGTGLGLSICHRIIADVGGEIRVESQIGKGTKFSVLLPVTVVEQTAPIPVPIAAAVVGRRGKILVVDDEVILANAIQRTLRRDHEVIAVASGRLALEHFAAGLRFDVILCDLMMPQMTGMELHAQLFAIDPEQAGRMIFLSGGAFTVAARTFLDAVLNERIEKPFDAPQLRAIVNERVLAVDAA